MRPPPTLSPEKSPLEAKSEKCRKQMGSLFWKEAGLGVGLAPPPLLGRAADRLSLSSLASNSPIYFSFRLALEWPPG